MTPRGDIAALLRHNRDFRRLWAGDIVSLFGDWFSSIAVMTLVWELTGSLTALSVVTAIRMGGSALASPLAGVIADRFDRRRLMVAADLLRMVVVLGFLVASRTGSVHLVYAVLMTQVSIAAVFRPARSALLPHLVAREQLLVANAVMSASWSTMLALGAAIGGYATSVLGAERVFVLDAVTFLVSAFCIAGIRRDAGRPPERPPEPISAAYRDIIEGVAYLVRQPRVGRIALAKAVWGFGGGSLVFLLTMVGETLTAGDLAKGLGLLLAARGIGTGLGPFIARRLLPDMSLWPQMLGVFVMISGGAYLCLGFVPWTSAVALLVVVAHAASGSNWVLSSVLLQHRAADGFRGRAFAAEWFALMGIEAVMVLLTGWIVDTGVLDVRTAVQVFAGIQLACGALWWVVNRRHEPVARAD